MQVYEWQRYLGLEQVQVSGQESKVVQKTQVKLYIFDFYQHL